MSSGRLGPWGKMGGMDTLEQPMSLTAPLSPAARTRTLERLAGEELDVLVIGGGVTGAGAALDAATRGLKVGLVEARDYAAGTSSRSTKQIGRASCRERV